MESCQDKVIQEKQELDKKIKSLQLFIESQKFAQDILEPERSDLKTQLKHMQVYTHILQKRINRF